MSGPCKYFDYFECHLAVLLWKIFSPIFITVGIGGNLLSLAVLSRRRMCNTTTSVYLRFLAIVDTLVLLIGNLRELIYYLTNIDIRELNDASCRIHYWLSFNVTALSGWLLSILTIDRLISVKLPLWARSTCSRKSALVISVVTLGCMFLINSHILAYLKRTEIRVPSPASNTTIVLDIGCLPGEPIYMMFWTKAWPDIVFVLYSILPILCLIVCNILLIKELTKRNNPLRLQDGLTLSSSQRKDFRSLTRMLISVSIFFAIISLPATVFMILETYLFNGTSARDISKRRLFWSIVSILMYSNNAVNFFLYCLSGSLFRAELKQMILKIKSSIARRITNRIAPNDTNGAGQSGAYSNQNRSTDDDHRFVNARQKEINVPCSVNCTKTEKTNTTTVFMIHNNAKELNA